VALAVTELSPSQISVGKDSSVPPPATELIAPARKADPNATAPVKTLNVDTEVPAYTMLPNAIVVERRGTNLVEIRS
jgi:hypothetical protein